MKTTFKTTSGSTWESGKSVRTSMPIYNGVLTGKHESHELNGENVVMLEVSHDYGTDMIFEDYISQ